MNKQQLLNIASRLGNCLQKYGAETFRIEDSIERVLSSLGATDINVFVINSCSFVSLKADGSDDVTTELRRCANKTPDLYKIDKLNSLCRKICNEKMSYDQITIEIDKIESKKPYSFIAKYLGFTLVSLGFCFLFGGGITEMVASLISSLAVFPTIHALEKLNAGIFFKNIIASGLIAIIAIFFSAFVIKCNVATVIIATFMNLVPGIALATSMRDIIAGDLISGKNTLTEALIIALGMALGAGIIMATFGFLI